MDALSALKIQPIKLLQGSHKDTGTTGSGCFMNVIAYLNGEAQITDKSPCVCGVLRPAAIVTNDMLAPEDRQKMLDFIPRAMGSVTDDFNTMFVRAVLLERMVTEIVRDASYIFEIFYNRRDRDIFDRGYGKPPQDVTDAMRKGRRILRTARKAHELREAADVFSCAAQEVWNFAMKTHTLVHPVALEHSPYDVGYPLQFFKSPHATAITIERTTVYNVIHKHSMRYLDLMLPPADAPTQAVIDRAQKLAEVYAQHTQQSKIIATA